jgi:hypothetical protein
MRCGGLSPRAMPRAELNTAHLGERRLFPKRLRPLPPGIEIPGYLRSPLPGASKEVPDGTAAGSPDFNPGRARSHDTPRNPPFGEWRLRPSAHRLQAVWKGREEQIR